MLALLCSISIVHGVIARFNTVPEIPKPDIHTPPEALEGLDEYMFQPCWNAASCTIRGARKIAIDKCWKMLPEWYVDDGLKQLNFSGQFQKGKPMEAIEVYCSWDKEQQDTTFDAAAVSMVDKYNEVCSESIEVNEECKTGGQAVDCMVNVYKDMHIKGECGSYEDARKLMSYS